MKFLQGQVSTGCIYFDKVTREWVDTTPMQVERYAAANTGTSMGLFINGIPLTLAVNYIFVKLDHMFFFLPNESRAGSNLFNKKYGTIFICIYF